MSMRAQCTTCDLKSCKQNSSPRTKRNFGMGRNSMRFLVVFTLSIILLQSPLLLADQVILKNGDQLTGSVVTSDDKVLIFKSEFAGEVKIIWDAVEKITSGEPLYITAKDGQVLVGNVKSVDGKFAVDTVNSG